MKVRFTYGNQSSEVDCMYSDDGSINCLTPTFQQSGETNLKMPCACNISVTMDGTNFTECEENFNIYSNEIFLTSVNPKCGSVTGGSEITLSIEIDPETA